MDMFHPHPWPLVGKLILKWQTSSYNLKDENNYENCIEFKFFLRFTLIVTYNFSKKKSFSSLHKSFDQN